MLFSCSSRRWARRGFLPAALVGARADRLFKWIELATCAKFIHARLQGDWRVRIELALMNKGRRLADIEVGGEFVNARENRAIGVNNVMVSGLRVTDDQPTFDRRNRTADVLPRSANFGNGQFALSGNFLEIQHALSPC